MLKGISTTQTARAALTAGRMVREMLTVDQTVREMLMAAQMAKAAVTDSLQETIRRRNRGCRVV